METVYNDDEYARLVEEGKHGDLPYAEPYSVQEVTITDNGEIWYMFLGPPGTMVTEGELELWGMLPEDKKKEVALNWRETRKKHSRIQGEYPHKWVE